MTENTRIHRIFIIFLKEQIAIRTLSRR